MKVHQRILLDLSVFLACFVATATILYKEVYTEEGVLSNHGLVLISEVKPTGGVGRTNDEFVELYNPQSEPVVIGGWSINKMTKSASSSERQQVFVFPSGLVLPSRSHVLVTHVESFVSSSADYLYQGQTLSDDNTVVLVSDAGNIVDLVGYGLAKNVEVEAADAPSAQLLSIERKPGGDLGNGYDSNSNKLDFFRAQPSPQNLHSPPSPMPNGLLQTTVVGGESSTGTELIGANILPTSTPDVLVGGAIVTNMVDQLVSSTVETISPVQTVLDSSVENGAQGNTTSSQYLLGSILITELYPMPKSGENEFVELFNRTPQLLDLTGWYITDGSGAKTYVSGTLASMQYLVIEKPKGSLNNDGDLVSLFAPNETVIDTVSYGEWNDGSPGNNVQGLQTGLSVVRIHDSEDSNLDYFDFGVSTTSTKGRANVYEPIAELVEEKEQKTLETDTVTTSGTKVSVKKSEPLYPRIVYQATSTVGTEIFFDASLSTGGEGLKQYLWEMDDGTILRGEMVGHIYQQADTYSVVLTVFDATGTEKHKTIKVVINTNPGLEIEKRNVQSKDKEVSVVTAKSTTKKSESVAVFTQISDLPKTKTNSLVRIRGILAAVFTAKTGTEFYLVGEPMAGSTAVGVLIKTKNNTFDARIGDVIEISGKYIVNTTSGNYLQYGVNDQLNNLKSGEIITPFKATIKDSLQLGGGYIQISGEVVEKKTNYIIVSDKTGEIKVMGNFSGEVKLNDSVIALGYVMQIKEGVIARVTRDEDLVVKNNVPVTTSLENVAAPKSNRFTTTFGVIGAMFIIAMGLLMKKLWFGKKDIIEATEI